MREFFAATFGKGERHVLHEFERVYSFYGNAGIIGPHSLDLCVHVCYVCVYHTHAK